MVQKLKQEVAWTSLETTGARLGFSAAAFQHYIILWYQVAIFNAQPDFPPALQHFSLPFIPSIPKNRVPVNRLLSPQKKAALLARQKDISKISYFRIAAPYRSIHGLFKNPLSGRKDIPHHCPYYVQYNRHLKHIIPGTCS